FRARHPVFRRPSFFTGANAHASGPPDIWWFRPDGRKMTQRDWNRGDMRTIGVFLNGEEIPTRTPTGERVVDDSFVLLFNAYAEEITFKMPVRRFGLRWELLLSTAHPDLDAGDVVVAFREDVPVEGRSIILLRRSA